MTTTDTSYLARRTQINPINAVGGVHIDEPGADLAVLLAIVSSSKNRALPAKRVVFGEVGLAGEVRPVTGTKVSGQERLPEAAKLGFTHAIVPKANKPKQKIEGLTIFAVERDEAGLETSPAACFVPAESERHAGREVEEEAVEYFRGA